MKYLNNSHQNNSIKRWGNNTNKIGKIQEFLNNKQLDYANQEVISESIEQNDIRLLKKQLDRYNKLFTNSVLY